jgi:hypothetical protein
MADTHPIFHKAREDSKGGYIQHVRSTSSGDLVSSDWSGGQEEDLVGYHGGREHYRNYSHPLLNKHRSAMNAEEEASDRETEEAHKAIDG